MMRVLHCVASVNPVGGGPIEAITRLGAVFPSVGVQPEILSLDKPTDPWVEAHPMRVHAMGPCRLKYRYTPRLVPWLLNHAREYDVVIINGIWQYSSFGTWRALSQTKTPYVVFPHGMLGPYFKSRYPAKHLKKWLYWPWADFRVLRDAAAVVFTCEEEQRLARQSFWLYRAREAVIAYGTVDPGRDLRGDIAAFFSEHGVLADRRYLLFLGRIHPVKGCDILIRAFAELEPSEPLFLVMAGPDTVSLKSRLVKLSEKLGVGERVIWSGRLTGRMKYGALASAEAFVMPSHHENFGIAVAEALGCGVPVLLTDKVNIWREIVGDGAGLVGPDTVDGVRNVLMEWISLSDTQRRAMTNQARPTFLKRFEIGRTAETLKKVLNDAVALASRRAAS